MKIRLLLLSLLCLPLAALRLWDLYHYINWKTGFFDADIVYMAFSILVYAAVFLLIPFVKRMCRRRGLAAFEARYSAITRIFLFAGAAALAFGLFLRLKSGLPQQTVKTVLFVLTALCQLGCAGCFLLSALSPRQFPPMASAVTGIFPPLYFAMDLLSKFFSGISNPYDTTTVFSFFSSMLLTVTALRWTQYRSLLSERRQRSFIATALVCLIFCLAERLPTLLIFLDPLDLPSLTAIGCEALGALALFFCSLDAAGEEF